MKAIFKELAEDRIRNAAGAADKQERRLDRALNAIWQDVLAGKPEAIAAFLKIEERRAKLRFLDAPIKVAPTDPTGTNPYMGMSDDRLRAEIVRYALASGDVAGSAPLSLDDECPPRSTAAAG
jgi:hypothetical protein